MKPFLKTPAVPEHAVSKAIIGMIPQFAEDLLNRQGVELYRVPSNDFVDKSIACHADVSVLHTGDGVFFCDPCAAPVVALLHPNVLRLIPVKGAYPDDCKLNIAIIGAHAFGCEKGSAPLVRDDLAHRGIQWHSIHQGYANCSVCAVNSRAMITDDCGIAHTAKLKGFDVLLIQKGDIRLSGHDYGFIGGTSAMIAPQKLVFFGDLSLHRDAERICAFLKKHGCSYVDCPGVPLTDIGGIVSVC